MPRETEAEMSEQQHAWTGQSVAGRYLLGKYLGGTGHGKVFSTEIVHARAVQVAIKLIPEAKILFLTQHNDTGLMKAALSSGGRGYVLKEDAESELLPAIEAVLRGEKFVSVRLRECLLANC